MKLRILFCLLCTVLLVACGWHPGHCAVRIPQLAAAMQEQYAQMRSLKASFTQKLVHAESGGVETRTGTLHFQRPLLIRWETDKPEPELLLVTEKEIWNYVPADKTATRYAPELASDSRTILQVITGQSRLDKDFSVKESGREGDLVILSLYPNEPTTQFTEGRLWVDNRTRLIRKAEVTDFYGNRNEISLDNIALNLVFEPGTFAFTPPAGVTVDDQLHAGQAGTPML